MKIQRLAGSQQKFTRIKPHEKFWQNSSGIPPELDADDFILFYYAGHGKVRKDNELYLYSKDTVIAALGSTSIPARRVLKYLQESYARRRVLILDCCQSGAIGRAVGSFRGSDVEEPLANLADSFGCYILTASTAIQLAEEREKDGHGLFTKALIDCLRAPKKESITVAELFSFASEQLKISGSQKPKQWALDVEGSPIEIGNFRQRFARLKQEELEHLISSAHDKFNFYVQHGDLSEAEVEKFVSLLKRDEARLTPRSRKYRGDIIQFLRGDAGFLEVFGAGHIPRPWSPLNSTEDEIGPPVSPPESPVAGAFAPRQAAPVPTALADKTARIWDARTGEPIGKPLEHKEKRPAEAKTKRKGEQPLADLTKFRDRHTPWCPEMVVLPAGSFLMGSPEGEEDRKQNEDPQHRVTIGYRFAIGPYAVTFDEFDYFCAATNRTQPFDKNWGRGRQPVINVSWREAVAYCVWLANETGKPYRLPSEAEWEYACRAGTTTRFSCGDQISSKQANCYASVHTLRMFFSLDLGQTKEVRSYPPNPWGLYDMHGNVWEWVEDIWHADYKGAPSDGSAWTDGEAENSSCNRVNRGGSWSHYPSKARSAHRGCSPLDGDSNVGFRVARTFDSELSSTSWHPAPTSGV